MWHASPKTIIYQQQQQEYSIPQWSLSDSVLPVNSYCLQYNVMYDGQVKGIQKFYPSLRGSNQMFSQTHDGQSW